MFFFHNDKIKVFLKQINILKKVKSLHLVTHPQLPMSPNPDTLITKRPGEYSEKKITFGTFDFRYSNMFDTLKYNCFDMNSFYVFKVEILDIEAQ